MAGIVAGILWIVGAPLGAGRSGRGQGRRRGRDVRQLTGPDAAAGRSARSGAEHGRYQRPGQLGLWAIASGGWWGVGLGASRQVGQPARSTPTSSSPCWGRSSGCSAASWFSPCSASSAPWRPDRDPFQRPFARYAAGGHRLVSGAEPVQPRRRAAAAAGSRRAAADAFLRRVGPDRQPARRRSAARLRRREPDARRMLTRRSKRPVSRMTTVTRSRTAAACRR